MKNFTLNTCIDEFLLNNADTNSYNHSENIQSDCT